MSDYSIDSDSGELVINDAAKCRFIRASGEITMNEGSAAQRVMLKQLSFVVSIGRRAPEKDSRHKLVQKDRAER
jgi:hypothetical protein